jgi:hypothetical protein
LERRYSFKSNFVAAPTDKALENVGLGRGENAEAQGAARSVRTRLRLNFMLLVVVLRYDKRSLASYHVEIMGRHSWKAVRDK